MRFHHIGIATKDIELTLKYVKNAYDVLHVSDKIFDKNQDATLCMITLKDGTNIELVSGEAVKTYLKKRIFLYHTCWEVDDMEKSIQHLQKNGDVLIVPPKEAILFDFRRVAFLHSKLGLIEILEKEKNGKR